MANRKKLYGKPLKQEANGYKVKPELKPDGNPSGKYAVITGRKKVHAKGLSMEAALQKAYNLGNKIPDKKE